MQVAPPGGSAGALAQLLQLQYSQMRTGMQQAAGHGILLPRLSPAAGLCLYQQGMAAAAARDACRWEAETISKRQRCAAEFLSFLQALPSAWGLSMQTARPLDIIMYSETVWRHQHQGSWLPDGSKVASPSGHNSMLSMLSTTFSLLGRSGPWDPVTLRGNPIDSEEVSSHRAAYRADLVKRGYREGSAIPISEETHRALVAALDSDAAAASSPIQLLTLASTALACTYLWDSSQRGKEVGLLELQDLTLPGGASALAQLLSTGLPQELIIEPLGTKTIKGRGKVAIPLQLAAPAMAPFCFIHRLPQFLRLCAAAGHPVTKYIFRPQSRGGGGFQEVPTTSSESACLSLFAHDL